MNSLPTLLFPVAVSFAVSWLPWFGNEQPPPPPPPEPEVVDVVEEEPPPPPEPPAPALFPEALPFHPTLDVTSLGMTYSSRCGGCHATSFIEWEDSSHHLGVQSTAWLDSIRAFGDGTVCTSCHRPFTEQHEKLTAEVIEADPSRPVLETNPTWHPTWQTESVGCAACHVREGVVIGQKTSDSPHPVRNSSELGTSEACQSCHQFQLPNEESPIYNTYQEWKNSAYSNAGIQCQDCHMIQGPVIGIGLSSHSMALSPKQGLTLTYQTPSFVLQRNQKHPFSVIIHNTGVGHSWPGSTPFNEKWIVLRLLDTDGKSLMKDILHPIGSHRDSSKAGPNIAVGNQHAFESTLELGSKTRAGYGELQILYINGASIETLDTLRIEIR